MNAILSSWPVLFVSALVYHISKLLTFSHDGTKLPRPSGGVTILLLLVISLFAVVLPEALNSTGNVTLHFVVWVANVAFMAVALRYMRKLAAFSGVLLILLGTHFIEQVLRYVFDLALGSGVTLLLLIWNLAAITVLLQRTPQKD